MKLIQELMTLKESEEFTEDEINEAIDELVEMYFDQIENIHGDNMEFERNMIEGYGRNPSLEDFVQEVDVMSIVPDQHKDVYTYIADDDELNKKLELKVAEKLKANFDSYSEERDKNFLSDLSDD